VFEVPLHQGGEERELPHYSSLPGEFVGETVDNRSGLACNGELVFSTVDDLPERRSRPV
jgi:hypothetical protein